MRGYDEGRSRWGATRAAARRLLGALALACTVLFSLTAPARAELLRGIVTDSLGTPIFNADFNVYDAFTGDKLVPSDKTDATGKYRLVIDAPDRYDILCRPAFVTPMLYAPRIRRGVSVSGTVDLDWVLPTAAQLLGRVSDSRNPDPLAGLNAVNIDFDRTDDGSRQPSLGNLTGLTGRFRVFIEGASYTVTVNPDTVTGLAPARVFGYVAPRPDPNEVLEFPLVPAVYLNGFIRDANGAPVAGAVLKFDDGTGVRVPSYKHTSGADGSVRVGVAPGTYRVTVEPNLGTPYAAIRVPGVDMTQTSTHDFTVALGATVTGSVTDKLGRPVAGADWDATLEGGPNAVTPGDNTDFDGQYRFVVAPGLYRLRLLPPASAGLDSVVFDNVDVSQDLTLNVDYAALSGGGGGASPIIRFTPKGNPTHTTAAFTLVLNKSIASALLEVYDVTGRRVRVLHAGPLAAGSNTFAWDGRRNNGAQAHTGVFLVRARLDGYEQVTRFVLLP